MDNKPSHQHNSTERKEVEVISEVSNVSMTNEWYQFAGESHFWFEWRFRTMLKQLKQLNMPLDQELKVFEVGCGTGTLRAELESVSRWTIDAADLNMNALLCARSCRGRTILYDVCDEYDPLINAYDIVILYDVLEHIFDTKRFLGSALRHLKPDGAMLVNVPALQSFYSGYDKLMGHYRRYNKKSLIKEFDDFDFQILDVRYWGFCMLPLLAIRKLVMVLVKESKCDRIRIGFNFPGSFAWFFELGIRLIMRLELMALSKPPLGTSLLMIGRKY